jgi:hypothetical protein
LRFFYNYDFVINDAAFAIHGTFDDVFTALHDCFNCNFPVPGAPAAFPSEGQVMPLEPCIVQPVCVNATVKAYARDQDGYLELIAQPGHFDGAGSTITFRFYTDSSGILHLNVISYVASNPATANPPDPVAKNFANDTWREFAANLGIYLYSHVCGGQYCPASPATPTGSATPCSKLSAVICTGGTATVLDSTCPGGTQQWFNATDLNNVAMHYTYADDSRACMRVTYNMYPTTANCSFWMYVPKGNATGDITFGYWDTSGTKHTWWINENAVDGWQYIFSAADVTQIQWQDNNGQYPNSTELGWSSDDQHGFAERC